LAVTKKTIATDAYMGVEGTPPWKEVIEPCRERRPRERREHVLEVELRLDAYRTIAMEGGSADNVGNIYLP